MAHDTGVRDRVSDLGRARRQIAILVLVIAAVLLAQDCGATAAMSKVAKAAGTAAKKSRPADGT